ncbi:D-alanyl-D-alanine carboxypeptidase/D-alanyl-D-alanine-endopeptidase [Streptacidiphilus sp. PB12-B1b]|uniref:D-alanyl-D-alanine carboxypeptidase/D-alanyl-D-alanine endopeptidase n=1 Tax=Streptacidiphilus sp. PB12-B1b TaxID=2705012 RepID=UPI0015FD3AC5|nr:D-alanyl-D-alanine carboxypeptidase/D-alanyl-D-alanine-endopeptidase [Streptacidiphilus sp. PB12-B1b]QMU74897.1 D-alanyl-D-alanine carboxypeptidase/D-alanyl-D-alanine-endopeptidase [Streptacidiphilus sp. PB12-B1b]
MGTTWWGRAARGYALAPTRTVVLVAGGLGLALAASSIAAAGPWQGGQRTAERRPGRTAGSPGQDAARASKPQLRAVPAPSWQPVPQVLAPAVGAVDAAAPLPTGAGLSTALGGYLGAPALGQVTASVTDVATGRSLYAYGGTAPQTPASTNKIATATAALTLLGPGHRFTTRVVSTGPGRIVLVGGGDPTLTAAATGGSDPQASLATLADRTAAALKAEGASTVRLGYDTALFTGSPLHPIGVNDNIALVQALTVDEGRLDPSSTEDAPRYADPAATAAGDFAALLTARGVTVQGSPALTTLPTATAPATASAEDAAAPATAPSATAAVPLAEVQSQPLTEIVERMLTDSDNDIAETLGHQVALAAGQPATFTGGVTAVLQTLRGLGIQLGGTRLYDSSGLDTRDAVPADVLTQLLALDASPAHPELRPIVLGLPVAGFTGTLGPDVEGFDSSSGLGVVRAKTGTLSAANTLAGLVVDRDGRLLAFAFMANGGGPAATARSDLDALAGRVAACGCR